MTLHATRQVARTQLQARQRSASLTRSLACLLFLVSIAGPVSGPLLAESEPVTDKVAAAKPYVAKRPAATLRIATYNVYNMFDVFDDPHSNDEGTRVKPRKEIEQVAKALRHIDADVIAVQEIENAGILKAMVNDMLGDMGYREVLVMPTNSERGGNLGFISRKPIVRVASHRWMEFTLPGKQQTWRFARDLLRVTVQATPDTTLDLYVVHLKSKRTVGDDKQAINWRTAEATAIRRLIGQRLKANPNDLFCVLGDFNDTPDSQPIEALLRAGPEQPAASTAPAETDNTLVDLHRGLVKDQRVTYRSEKYGNATLDYILASPALAKRVVKGSAKVIEDKTLLAGSDHAPVVVDVNLKK